MSCRGTTLGGALEAQTFVGARVARTLAGTWVARSLGGAREAQEGRWTGPADAKVSWTGPAEARGAGRDQRRPR